VAPAPTPTDASATTPASHATSTPQEPSTFERHGQLAHRSTQLPDGLPSAVQTVRHVAARLHTDQSRFGEIVFGGMRRTERETFIATLDRVLSRLHAMRSSADEAE
jgi:hypothetical protein